MLACRSYKQKTKSFATGMLRAFAISSTTLSSDHAALFRFLEAQSHDYDDHDHLQYLENMPQNSSSFKLGFHQQRLLSRVRKTAFEAALIIAYLTAVR